MRNKTFALVILAFLLASGLTSAQNDSEQWLAVEVTNESGRPLKNACVTFVPKEGEIVFRKANSRGQVILKRPAAGDYRVVVKVDGYEAQKKEVSIGERSETVAFALKMRGTR